MPGSTRRRLVPQTAEAPFFPGNQWGIGFFGESDNGNVHVSSSQHTYTTTVTTHTGVENPTTPATPPIITIASHPTFRATATLKNGGDPGDPTFTTRTIASSTRPISNTIPAAAGWTSPTSLTGTSASRLKVISLAGPILSVRPPASLSCANPFDFGARPVGGYSKDDKNPRAGMDSKDYKGTEMTEPTWGLAPYFICGGGAQWDGQCQGIADVGGGVEARFSHHWAVFTDCRWFVHNASENYAATRLGLLYEF